MTSPRNSSRRGWFQISLRTLLLVMLLVAMYFAGYSTAKRQVEQALREERAVRTALEAELKQAQATELAGAKAARFARLAAQLKALAARQEAEFAKPRIMTLQEEVEAASTKPATNHPEASPSRNR
jgi:uncharacterized protein HemX